MSRLPVVFLLGVTFANACGAGSIGAAGGHSGLHGSGGAGGVSLGLGGRAGSGGAAAGGGGGQSDAGVVRGGGGQSGAGGAAGCQPAASGGGVMTWDENGTPQCGIVAVGNAMINAANTFISISGTTAAGVLVEITVSDASGLGGVYSCKNDASVNDLYVHLTYSGGNLQDCTITIDSSGTSGSVPATGSFSATLTRADGGAIDVTNGTFNTPVFLPPP